MRKKEKINTNIEIDHNFLIVCNNYIVSILEMAEKYKWSSTKINIKEKDKIKLKKCDNEIEYLRNHGYAKVVNKLLYRHMLFSLISDYNLYIYDAISCASKKHFGTAFTLLRKPLKDDLLLIELFYTKRYRAIPKFLNEPIENFAIDRISEDDKKKILRKCCRKINFFTGKRMYDLRYSKKSKVGLEKIWNKTSHIITTCKNYKTMNRKFKHYFRNRR